MKVRIHVFIKGRVQGVFFRVKTRSEAINRKVTGWVRNLFDGRVEAIFEGEKEDVNNLINFCKKGPQGAHVTTVDIYSEQYIGEFTDFKIRKTVNK
jgi:acylphosphatase